MEATSTVARVAAVRNACRNRPLRPYEELMSGDRLTPSTEERALALLREGWQVADLAPVRLEPPLAWDEVCASNRSAHYHLHAWEPLAPVLSALQHTGDRRFLTRALALALDWLSSFPSVDDRSPFAWYDMAIGLRAYRLAFLADVASRDPAVSDQDVSRLIDGLFLHRDALADEQSFAAHSNHGFYQAAGQLAMATRFPDLDGMSEACMLGQARLKQLVASQFDAGEGVHLEHSPGYHSLVLGALERVVTTGLMDDSALGAVKRRAEDALAWFALPNQSFAMFGDTPHRFLHPTPVEEVESEALRFVMTRGAAGSAPPTTARAFPRAGYAVVRDRWPETTGEFSDCGYLAQTCCFHSTAHKHADDLSFVWYDRGQELIVDAGRYGYLGRTEARTPLWRAGFAYSDPRRVYVESTRAHSTVEVDDTSFPRRDVEPYGSALLGLVELDRIKIVESLVRRGRTFQHRRLLIWRPRGWLLVVDIVGAALAPRHIFNQRFQFAPELEAAGSQPGLALASEKGALHVTALGGEKALALVRGQTDPRLLGWTSREAYALTPAWSGGFRAGPNRRHAFATLLSFSPPKDWDAGTVNRLFRRGGRAEVTWTLNDERHTISIARRGSAASDVCYAGPSGGLTPETAT